MSEVIFDNFREQAEDYPLTLLTATIRYPNRNQFTLRQVQQKLFIFKAKMTIICRHRRGKRGGSQCVEKQFFFTFVPSDLDLLPLDLKFAPYGYSCPG